ncbi:class II aldolase/adducin family protein [Aphanothece sacrum]|uniref:Membrane protein n=1 Tax=Aphanothece sacrum FPU1 TaxID=1920663 RepID=A0A401IHT2_APHSA|nr:class II aldolase/adducin family protein [Aphanothece sacrum]GBF80865.1 membrane protein [Aphanothece sacrum FPU1]GBF85173.1 membrane protein [Aphanothece sacrum FPU3]
MNQLNHTIDAQRQFEIFDESQARIYLAAVYRLIDFFGWADLTLTHASTRVPNSDCHFLINPFGIKFNQIKASDLVKLDFESNIIGNNNQITINPTGFIQHSSIYKSRPDINTIIHAHTPYGVALSTLDSGLLYIDQAAMVFYDKIAYHDYDGLAVDHQEGKRIAEALGKDKLCLIQRNHGITVCGQKIDDAFIYLYMLEFACRTQILAMSTGAKLIQPSSEIVSSFSKQIDQFKQKLDVNPSTKKINSFGFKALINKLDRLDPSYRD